MTDSSDKLVVNAVPLLGPLTGVGHVTAEVSKRLDHSSEFETEFFTPLKRFESLDEIEKGYASARLLQLTKRVFRKLPLKGVLRRQYEKLGMADCQCGLYWEPNFIPIDALQARKVVTTVHDLSFHEHPEWHPHDRVSFFPVIFSATSVGRTSW